LSAILAHAHAKLSLLHPNLFGADNEDGEGDDESPLEPMDEAGLRMTDADIANGEGRGTFDKQILYQGTLESFIVHSYTVDHPDVRKVLAMEAGKVNPTP